MTEQTPENSGNPMLMRRIIYAAFEKPDRRRHPQTREWYEDLPAEPGLAHALNAARTYDGDPWRRHREGRREPYFYGGRGPNAECGTEVLVLIPVEFDAADPDACPRCVDRLTSPRREGRSGRGSMCGSTLRILEHAEDEELSVYICTNDWGHEHPHRASSGATWETGPDDFIPAPDGFV